MKIKLKITPDSGLSALMKNGSGTGPIEVTTNLFCIAEWERTEGRKISDGRGIGVTDLVCWAYTMLKQTGLNHLAPEPTWREWLQNHPDCEITSVDETNPNPTDAATTDTN